MKGNIYKRSKNNWTIVYDLPVDGVTGKRRQTSQTVKGTKRDAERTLREVLGISRNFAYELVKQGKLPVIKLGKKRLVIAKVALNRMLDEGVTQYKG